MNEKLKAYIDDQIGKTQQRRNELDREDESSPRKDCLFRGMIHAYEDIRLELDTGAILHPGQAPDTVERHKKKLDASEDLMIPIRPNDIHRIL